MITHEQLYPQTVTRPRTPSGHARAKTDERLNGHSPTVYVEVQICLCDHHPIQHNVEHHADENGAISEDAYDGVHGQFRWMVHPLPSTHTGCAGEGILRTGSCANYRTEDKEGGLPGSRSRPRRARVLSRGGERRTRDEGGRGSKVALPYR